MHLAVHIALLPLLLPPLLLLQGYRHDGKVRCPLLS